MVVMKVITAMVMVAKTPAKKKLQKMIALGKVQRSNSDGTIEAAKKRFLERKKKMANKGAKKK